MLLVMENIAFHHYSYYFEVTNLSMFTLKDKLKYIPIYIQTVRTEILY